MDEHTELLSRLQSDPAAALEMMKAQLAERAAENPAMAMMMQLMAARTQPSNHDETSEQHERVERVRAHARELRNALANAHELLDGLAAALGACAACWGGDDACPTCLGRGSPGFCVPDGALFEELVAPAVERRARSQNESGQGREP